MAEKTAVKAPAAEVDATPSLLRPDQVILRPLVTEKGVHRSSRHNAYAFEVAKGATKEDIRRAVELMFSVKVVRVHTQNRKGKPRRSRFKSAKSLTLAPRRPGVTGLYRRIPIVLSSEVRDQQH